MTDLDFTDRSAVATIVGGPLLMLFLCFCGMAIGLAIDCGSVPLDVLASLCIAGSTTLAASAGTHFALLPATHLLMLAGAIVAVAMTETPANRPADKRAPLAPYVASAACAAAMVAGMVVGGWVGPSLVRSAGIASSAAQLMSAMAIGMVAGMAATTPLFHRLARRGATWRNR